MKKLLLFTVMQVFFIFPAAAQVLDVNNNQQLFNEWCWAGCSKTILDYYGYITPQCEIAEWVRTTATFHDYGDVDCCVSGTQGCNYWNYLYGSAGSIQDILIHFGEIPNTGMFSQLTQAQITTEIQNNRLFVIRWGWSTSGGHFIVGHGINGNNIYFMNPWFGEGLHIGTYAFVQNGVDNTSSATHTWTHSIKITGNMLAIADPDADGKLAVYPNPFASETTVQSDRFLVDATLTVYNSCGQAVKKIEHISGQTMRLYRDNLAAGLYFLRLTQDNYIMTKKLLITD